MERDSEENTKVSERAEPRPDAGPLRPVELLAIALFWTFFGTLTVATATLDSHGSRPRFPGLVPRLVINPIVWAAVTTFVFWFGRRVSLDRTFWRKHWWAVILGGAVIAYGLDLVSDALWDAFTPAAIVRETQAFLRQRRFRPGPGNLTWLDDYAVVFAALGAASARGWVLRDRWRRRESREREARLMAESERARADSAQLEAQLAEARLDALRRQLDPHFLFNTLNAVSALVERDPRGVRRMIGQLSDLLRHSMDGASVPEVALREELDLLERYVDIMRVRFENLSVETHADPRTLDALVPNLILQPLVENAIRHGIEPRAEGGRVIVETLLDGATLVLRVHDDGPGRPVWPPPGEAVGGVGLRNTEARLAQLHGEAQRLTVGPGPGGGMLAEVRLPYRTSAEGVQRAR
ncbi:MAG TPA: histidine kinase [Gemmatimonadaceae bacterium]|nr:histidine kinase [Gemmatimonadaceae bacterium]